MKRKQKGQHVGDKEELITENRMHIRISISGRLTIFSGFSVDIKRKKKY